MALAIRMSRAGRKNLPFYRIVVADSRMPRDGRYIEKVGTYDPRKPQNDEARVRIVQERIEYWMSHGAKPSRRVQILLAQQGIGDMPEIRETPQKSAPSEKTKMRAEEKVEKKKAAAEAAKAAEEEAKAAAEAAAAAPAEEPKAEEAAPAEAAPEAAPAEEAKAEAPAAQEEKPEINPGDTPAETPAPEPDQPSGPAEDPKA